MHDLDNVQDDCAWLEGAMEQYLIMDYGPDNMYKMINDPSYKMVDATRRSIMKYLKNNPEKKVLVVYVFACHGVVERG